MTGPQVVVVGSVNMDLAVRVPHLPRPGETVPGGELEQGGGGKGANQAVAVRRLGARSALIARVGDDEFGHRLRAELAEAGVEVAGVGTAGVATGTALIVIGPDGDNTITVSPGANAALDPAVLDDHSGRLVTADALLLQLEVPVATCLAAARLARAAGVLVVLNAAPLPATIGAELRELIAAADVLVVNEVEAAGLIGPPGDLPVLELPSALGRFGPSEVVVTLGSRGAVHTGPDGSGDVHVPAFAVAAVDAVGAGDAFCAALAVARADGTTPLGAAVRRACAAGALATTGRGARAALPTGAEVDALLARQGGAEGADGATGTAS
ncbi:ribokinase [Kitasatospora sp. NPDC096147]|uniref:ribokinase n=1 Tax=Kitasatospora sp. NPDC096147 TaxID=3364093 RepID=UPI0038301391